MFIITAYGSNMPVFTIDLKITIKKTSVNTLRKRY